MVKLSTRPGLVIRFTISFGLLAALVWLMHKDAIAVLNILKKSDKILFLIAILVNIPLSIVLAYRLKLVMIGQNIALSLKDAIYLTFIGYFFNNFLPTAIGGDVAKAYYASKKTNNKVASYAAVITDRLLGFFATLGIAILGIIFLGKELRNNAIVYAMYAIIIISIIGTLFLLKKNNKSISDPVTKDALSVIKNKILRLQASISTYSEKPVLLLKTFGISLILQGLAISSVYLFVLCVGGSMPFVRLFLVIPLVWTISMLPSLNGLGVREGAFVYFLKGYIGPEKACAISILWLGLILVYSVIGGLFHLLYPLKIDEKI